MIYDLTPVALAEAHQTFVSECGVGIVGGAVAPTPEHVRACGGDEGLTPRRTPT